MGLVISGSKERSPIKEHIPLVKGVRIKIWNKKIYGSDGVSRYLIAALRGE